MPSKKEDLINLIAHELYGTRMMIERVPGDRFDWKPHEKSFSLGELATHIANLLFWMTTIVQEDSLDLAAQPAEATVPDSRQALIDLFDANADDLHVAVEGINETDLGEAWRLHYGKKTLMEEPRVAVFYKMGLHHMVHHRGQLSVYLRMLDVPVPPTYGPTADEQASF